VAAVTANDPRDESVQVRLKDQPEPPPAPGPGLAARRHQGWASRFERGQGGRPDTGESSAGLGTGWEVVSYLISGMLAYGGIGWLIGRAVHIELLFPVGMAVGLAIALGWVIYRYGRAGGDQEK
jgi:F0F1-type ATP synthase assembly protein I